MKSTLALVLQEINQLLAWHKYLDKCGAAINEQIRFFKESGEEEREHAEKLMKYHVIIKKKSLTYSLGFSPFGYFVLNCIYLNSYLSVEISKVFRLLHLLSHIMMAVVLQPH